MKINCYILVLSLPLLSVEKLPSRRRRVGDVGRIGGDGVVSGGRSVVQAAVV